MGGLALTQDQKDALFRAEIANRFPELVDDSELNGGDAVDRLWDWFFQVGGLDQ